MYETSCILSLTGLVIANISYLIDSLNQFSFSFVSDQCKTKLLITNCITA